MGPDERFCQICDGVSVVGCFFRGGSSCRPKCVRMPAQSSQKRDGLDEDEIAKKAGYVRLEPGQVVVDGKAIVDYCGACDDESMTVVCDGCVIKPIRDAIKEARDE